MKFKYKSAAQVAAMSDAERDEYATAKREHEAAQIDEQVAKGLQPLLEKLETAATKEEVETIKGLITEVKEWADTYKENLQGAPKKETTLLDEVKANMETIKSTAPQGTPMKEFVVKASALRSSVSGNPYFQDAGGIGQLAHRKLTVYDMFRKIPVGKNNNGTVKYVDWDSATIARAAAAVAEGGTFPESTAAWVTGTLVLQKVGDSIPLSEEFAYDDAMFAAELDGFLRTNIAIKVDTDLISGNGTAPNIKGMLAYIPAYTAASAGIVDASIYDLLVKAREAITVPYGSKYDPNVALMNTTDINKMKLKKDANNNYVMPPFVDKNGQLVDGMTILECNALTANTMIVGDSRYGAIYEEPGIYVATGYDGSDWSQDMMTMKARRRLNLLIRGVDSTGWLKVASISASITALA